MPTAKVIKSKAGNLSKNQISLCVDTLKQGGILVIPTDTVYGIACNAFDPVAIKKVYYLKGRNYYKPLPILLNSVEQLSLVAADIPKETNKLTDQFWPGPLTLVFKTGPFALQASRGKETIAVRVPKHGVAKTLLKNFQMPLAATSANLSGEKSLTSAAAVIRAFKNKVDLIVDGGSCKWGKESSVVDVSHYPFVILREGVILKKELLHTLYQVL